MSDRKTLTYSVVGNAKGPCFFGGNNSKSGCQEPFFNIRSLERPLSCCAFHLHQLNSAVDDPRGEDRPAAAVPVAVAQRQTQPIPAGNAINK